MLSSIETLNQMKSHLCEVAICTYITLLSIDAFANKFPMQATRGRQKIIVAYHKKKCRSEKENYTLFIYCCLLMFKHCYSSI